MSGSQGTTKLPNMLQGSKTAPNIWGRRSTLQRDAPRDLRFRPEWETYLVEKSNALVVSMLPPMGLWEGLRDSCRRKRRSRALCSRDLSHSR
jgi:hypothetical protein